MPETPPGCQVDLFFKGESDKTRASRTKPLILRNTFCTTEFNHNSPALKPAAFYAFISQECFADFSGDPMLQDLVEHYGACRTNLPA